MTTTSGVELLVYLKDGVTPYAYIPRFVAPSSMDEMAQGPGANTFQVLTSDQALKDYPKLLDYRNIVFVLVNGVRVNAMVIQTKKTVIVDSNSGTDTYVEVSGEGLRTWFNDAELYPEKGLHAYSFDTRVFSPGSEYEQYWKNAGQWTAPVVAANYVKTPPASGAKPWDGNPQGWPPQGASAKWIWYTAYSLGQPLGTAWLRRNFFTGAEVTFQLFAAADDEFEAYIDGQLILTGQDFRQTQTVQFKVPAGNHVLSFKATNVFQVGGVIAQLSLVGTNGLASGDFLHTGDGSSGWSVTNGVNLTSLSWTPGAVLAVLLYEAQTRGVLFPTLLTQTFDQTHDSYGNAWAAGDFLDWSFNVGDSYASVISQIEAVGYEVWIDPVAMTINIAAQRGIDHSISQGTKDAVVLAPGKNLLGADSSGQASMVNVLLTKSSDGWVETVDPVAQHITDYGRLEGSLSVTATGAMAKKLSAATISGSSATQIGSTYDIVAVPGATPKVDFNTGDWVLAPNESGAMVPRRVMSITLTTDDAGNPLWACEFDTIFQELEQRLQQNINAMTNGTVSSASSSSGNSVPNNPTRLGITPPNTLTQEQAPAAPTGLACAMSVSFNSVGTPVVQATISWSPVTVSVLGLETWVFGYQVWGINASAVNPVPHLMATSMGGATTATITDLAYGATWQFYIVAVTDANVYSPASAILSQTLNPALPALTAPTDPVVTTKLGVAQVAWDGNLATTPSPTAPPIQFSRVSVVMATSATGTYNLVGQNLLVAGQVVVPGLTVGTTYWFKLIAVDKLGNSSPLTNAVSVTVVGVATLDLDASVQNALDTANSNASSAQSAANGKNTVYYGSTAPTVPLSGSSFTVNDIWFDTDSGNAISYWDGSSWTASQLGTNAIANASITDAQIGNVDAGKITTGFLAAARIQADTITAPMLLVGDFTNLAAGSDFEGVAAANPWNLGAAWAIDTAQHNSGTKSLKCTGTLTGTSILSTVIAAQAAAQYYVEFYVYRDAAWNGTSAGSVMRFVNQASTSIATFAYDSTSIPAAAWTKVSGTVTVPTGTTSLTVSLNTNATAGNLWIDDVTIRLKATGTLIVDGTITAAALAAGSVTASELAANAVTANSIAAGAIDGFVITGSTIRTAASGQRVQLDSSGLRGFNSAGTVVTSVSTTGLLTATGATITGTLQTGTTGQRAVMSGSGVTWYSVNGGTSSITGGETTVGGVLKGQLTLAASSGGSVTIGQSAGNGGSSLYTDSAWIQSILYGSQVQLPMIYVGTFSDGTTVNAGANHNTTISFPSGTFTSAPTTVLVMPGNARFTPGVSSITTTSAIVSLSNWSSGAGIPGLCGFVAFGY